MFILGFQNNMKYFLIEKIWIEKNLPFWKTLLMVKSFKKVCI